MALRRGAGFANLTLPWNRIVVLGFVLLVLFFTAHSE